MANLDANTNSSSISFSAGKVISLRCDWRFLVEFMAFMSPVSFLNLPFTESKKIHPHFKRLGSRKVSKIVQQIYDVTGVNVHTYNFTGIFLVTSFSELNSSDNIIVGLAGHADDSIRFCTEIFEKFVAVYKTKMIVLVLLEGDLYDAQESSN